jgi:carbonic anhydrase
VNTLPHLFERNRTWAAARVAGDPHFFDRLCDIQNPDYLWIGCSDSRVPANEIVGLAPGELFVHRNVANLVLLGDSNCLAVVQYAIETLGVRHIIVCGHYGCGGVRAALERSDQSTGHIERWLAPLRHLANARGTELAAIEDHGARWRRLCEINVVEQVQRLLSTDVLIEANARGITIGVHGWIYDLRDGLLRDIFEIARE